MVTVGDRIRQVRQEQDVTQQELADYIGVSKQAVYKYENNIVTNIPTDKVDAIAKRLRVSPAYLMGWEEQPAPHPKSPLFRRALSRCQPWTWYRWWDGSLAVRPSRQKRTSNKWCACLPAGTPPLH